MNGIATVVPDDSLALPFKDLIAFGLDTLPIGYIPPLLLPLPLPNGRVTESYAAPMMSLSHARCRLLSTDKSGRR